MSLISDFSEGKLPYQTYVLEHGIERITILIPLQSAKLFEEKFKTLNDSKPLILQAAQQLGGKVKFK